jgi:hypothetical protein
MLLGATMAAMVVTGALAAPYRPPRAPDGHPDLQGTWSNESGTPFERPKDFQGLVASPAEARAYERKAGDRYARATAPLKAGELVAPAQGPPGQDSQQWYGPPLPLARVGGQARTSWIVDPADGRLPYRPEARSEASTADEIALHRFDNPEQRDFDERCILGAGGGASPPFLDSGVNNLVRIVQARGAVVLLAETNHDARVVRMGDPRRLPAQITPWMGDSIGHWNGDTLVVETTGFHPGERYHYAGTIVVIGTHTRVTERFTRIGPKALLYRFEVADPGVYTQPWRAEMVFRPADGEIFEYACHEGNYALANILAGARRSERERAPSPP